MVLGIEKADLTPDELGMRVRSPNGAGEGHLALHLLDRMRTVDADPVRVTRVVTGCAGEVAARKHPMGAFTPDSHSAERLGLGSDVLG